MENLHMTQQFGASGINREMFEDCFEQPIDMRNVSDEAMYKLSEKVESIVREKYPKMADKMFAFWRKDEPSDEEYDAVATYHSGEMWDYYWDTLEECAIQAGGVVCESDDDDDDDNDDDSTPTAIATESFLSDMRMLRLDIEDILDSMPYSEALTMRLRAIDRKLADIADDFNSMKSIIDFLGKHR